MLRIAVSLTLKALMVSQFLHNLEIFPQVERLEPPRTKHEMSDTVQRITVEKYLKTLAYHHVEVYVGTYVDVYAGFTCFSALCYKSLCSLTDYCQGLRFHDISHGITFCKKTFSLAVL